MTSSPPDCQVWDIGDSEPPEGVIEVQSLCEIFDDDYDQSMRFGRTYDGEWKTYLGGKLYLAWGDVVRRFGPVVEVRHD